MNPPQLLVDHKPQTTTLTKIRIFAEDLGLSTCEVRNKTKDKTLQSFLEYQIFARCLAINLGGQGQQLALFWSFVDKVQVFYAFAGKCG